jgi:hypothetical protein
MDIYFRSDYEIPILELRARTALLRATEQPLPTPVSNKQPRKRMPLITGRVSANIAKRLRAADAKAANDNEQSSIKHVA